MFEFDTIAAIATPVGVGGIGIIRISGDKSFEIADKIFKSRKYKTVFDIPNRYAALGEIYDNDELIDEAILIKYKAPNSYTKEDVVEIQCHGGMVVLREILNLVIKNGARHALAGEFTKRAFLNGRIDLSQAEAIIDIINSKTHLLKKNATLQLKGHLSRKIEKISNDIVTCLAMIEASIDFPEHDIEEMQKESIKQILNETLREIQALVKSFDVGKAIKSGVWTVIVGRPNVGKSSLLNRLLKEERAIVTDIPGTTRDIIEEVLDIEGIPIILVDTAGVRQTEDVVEKMGVERTLRMVDRADLVLFVIEADKIDDDDIKIFESIKDKKYIIIVNKTDRNVSVTQEKLKELFGKEGIFISLAFDENLSQIEKAIKDEVISKEIEIFDEVMITNLRHKELLLRAIDDINSVIQTIDEMPLDIVSIDLKNAANHVNEIIGRNVNEDMLDKIFSMFCIGK